MTPPPQVVPPKVRKDIESVLQYNWEKELDDFAEHHCDDTGSNDHIFPVLVRLDNFLNDTSRTVTERVRNVYPNWPEENT